MTTDAHTPDVEAAEQLKCLDDYGEGTCRGAVKYRMPLSGTGIPYPRCDHHWDKRLQTQERLRRDYGVDSDVPPDGFDETYAGERWSDDY